MKFLFTIILFVLTLKTSSAQLGGESVFPFLNLNMSSNYAALGGYIPSVDIKGTNSLTSNPALIDSLDNLTVALNYTSYVSDIKYGTAVFSGKICSKTMLSGYVEFFDYGDFLLTDEAANELGNFTCKDHVFAISSSREFLKNFRAGVTMKTIFSKMETYKSNGLCFDFGLLYDLKNQKITFALTAMNLGFQIKTYTENTREKLPSDLRFAISKTLEHAPLRFSLTAHNLQKPKLDDDFLTSFADHFIISAEIFPEKAVSLKGGFNFLAHNDLYISEMSPFPGFSIGIDVRIKRFSIQYSRQCIAFGAASNMISAEVIMR
ncbi:MAG: type IX secretion system protein PorQ [Bacteroidales bacterium]|nr:type IX secretion system protein PorQ [Bacteroidales bacterium]